MKTFLKRVAIGTVVLSFAANLVSGSFEPSPERKARIQAPHAYTVNVRPDGMLPSYMCDYPIKNENCAEDTIGWAGSSEDDRVKR